MLLAKELRFVRENFAGRLTKTKFSQGPAHFFLHFYKRRKKLTRAFTKLFRGFKNTDTKPLRSSFQKGNKSLRKLLS